MTQKSKKIAVIVAATIAGLGIISYAVSDPSETAPSNTTARLRSTTISTTTQTTTSPTTTILTTLLSATPIIPTSAPTTVPPTPTSAPTTVPPTPTSAPTTVPPTPTLAPTTVPPTPTSPATTSTPIVVMEFTSPIVAGQTATLKIKGKPNTDYKITVIYKSGASEAAGLGLKTSDANGVVSWTWKVGANTTPGNWSVTVAGGDKTLTLDFKVT